ncbi:MAG: hypothetical protein HLUCCX14_07680 [Marinobacter excellens HL-55]|uniref:Uncharacterized protein n=1 Tax=Marinobacter excellens HL-55 TaxID=1305731 RepID=A0A0P8BL53_9GAMM|nr:MAG: hypothetical protein HLUCCX14_07680 [Marinobacter excellens HL-55]
MKLLSLLVVFLVALPAVASEKDEADQSLVGLTFGQQSEVPTQRIMRNQYEQSLVGEPEGELPAAIVVKSWERLSDSFDQPIPVRIRESTSDD